jgi:hypothetical protein
MGDLGLKAMSARLRRPSHVMEGGGIAVQVLDENLTCCKKDSLLTLPVGMS